MGGCTSNQRVIDPQAKAGGIQSDTTGRTWCSGMDLARIPNAEKKTISSCRIQAASLGGVGHACRKGRKADGTAAAKQPNQDAWTVHQANNGLTVYGVFDGHGSHGHQCSDFVKQHIPKVAARTANAGDADAETKLREGFKAMQRTLETRMGCDCGNSGTTATVVLHDKALERLTVSHVGDSAAVLVKSKVGSSDKLEAVQLTRDHKPDLEDEKKRIEHCGGQVVCDAGYHRVVRRNGKGPGLNMSRSLGDSVAHKACGVSCEPEVSHHDIRAEDHALLVCSDGIWEVIKPQEAADILKDYGPREAMAAARHLADEAVSRWLRGTNGKITDDITVLLVFLNQDEDQGALARGDTITSTEAPSQLNPSDSLSEESLLSILETPCHSEEDTMPSLFDVPVPTTTRTRL